MGLKKRSPTFYILAAFFALFVLFMYGPMFAIFTLSLQGQMGHSPFPFAALAFTGSNLSSFSSSELVTLAQPFSDRSSWG